MDGMLKYAKSVLEKVSFDKELFGKELSKSVKRLSEPEAEELELWCLSKFGDKYEEIIEEVFNNIGQSSEQVS